jgi:SEC-C motif-containing protein
VSAAPKPAEFTPPRADQPCPCGSKQKYSACCLPILKQEKPAANAEQLMRSRFTAHVARDYAHLHRTVLETSKEPYVEDPQAGPTNNWTRLVIHSHEHGPKPDFSTVDFTAYFLENDVERAFHEKAEFQKIDGTWLYTKALRQGPAPIKATKKEVGRNDPCPCGSGKKYKQCCINKA